MKVAQKGRKVPSRAMPLVIAAIECSRMPKWMLLPAKGSSPSPAAEPTKPLPLIVELFEPARSAEPPTRKGASSWIRWITAPESFVAAKQNGQTLVTVAGLEGVIVGGDSYGQGSSREHAALCPMYLGVRVVLAKAIERMHKANLINFGIVPLIFETAKDYERLEQEDEISIDGLRPDALERLPGL